MSTLSFKVAFPIIIAGFFIMVTFMAINYENLSTSFYVIFSFLVIYIFSFGFAIGYKFVAPVKRLLQRASDLSNGDFKSRFYSESKDEIGQLSNVFNTIAEKLEESNYENEKTKKLVGMRVEAETQSLKEIISALEQKVQNRTLEAQKIMRDLEKFQEYSRVKDSESAQLKNEIAALKEKLEKHSVKKKSATRGAKKGKLK